MGLRDRPSGLAEEAGCGVPFGHTARANPGGARQEAQMLLKSLVIIATGKSCALCSKNVWD